MDGAKHTTDTPEALDNFVGFLILIASGDSFLPRFMFKKLERKGLNTEERWKNHGNKS